MAEPMNVEFVAADRLVWEGEAINVIVRTTEGDIGILANHEPLLASLVPCAAEVVTADGRREILAVDGGFVSVAQNRVSVIAQHITLGEEVSAAEAQRELDKLQTIIDEGDASDAEMRRFHLATAQVKAAAKKS